MGEANPAIQPWEEEEGMATSTKSKTTTVSWQ
jgi:hypothetical protein